MFAYADTTGQKTNSPDWTPIPGLEIPLPSMAGSLNRVLLILNIPRPYAEGGQGFPGGEFAIQVGGQNLRPTAEFSYENEVPPSTGRMPTTLVAEAMLDDRPLRARAVWKSVRGATVIIDSACSLSAIFG